VGALVFKEIKATRLKDGDMRLALLNGIRRMGTKVRKDFEKCVESWEHEVKFEQELSLTAPGPTLYVYTTDEIFGYVDKGTKAHEIWAGYYTGKSDKKALAFPSIFSPKTRPGVIGSGPGASGGETVVRPFVMHPGTEPRRFSQAIQEKWEHAFKDEMEEVMREVAQASAHSIR